MMIKTKHDLHEWLDYERKLYFPNMTKKEIAKRYIQSSEEICIWRYQKALRKTEYFYNNKNGLNTLLYLYYLRKKNKLGVKLGIFIWSNCIEKGLLIYHAGSIIVNGNAKIGMNCQLHGENCIGNKGNFDNRAPVLGDNVDIGVGAKVIGPVSIADEIKIGANAVVTKSCYTKGAVLVGIPAREVTGK